MFAVLGVLTLGGIATTVAVLKPEYGVADAVDAGVLTVSVPAQIRCRVQVRESCRGKVDPMDGGPVTYTRSRYMVAKLKGRMVSATNPRTLLLDPDRDAQGERCLTPVGTPTEACEVLEEGSCTDPTVCAANADPVQELDQCACRARGQVCRYGDGGIAPMGAPLRAAIEGFSGAGCRRYYCGPVINGENDIAWPPECL